MLRRDAEKARMAAEQARHADDARFQVAVREAVREQAEISAEMRVAAAAFGANPAVANAEQPPAPEPRARRKRR